MKTIKFICAALVVIGMAACSKDNPSIEGPDDEGITEHKELIVGYVRNALREEPCIWENGELTVLPFDESQNTNALQIVVSGKDTYILGSERSPNGFVRKSRIVLWKNGELIPVTDGNLKAEPIKMVVENTNVYILGSETDQSEGSATRIYKYWKNGIATTLNSGDAEATDMVVIAGDVYISGNEVNARHKNAAKFWKNGIAQDISDGQQDAYAISIAVEGQTVAVLYREQNGTPFGNALNMWKNGKISSLINNNSLSLGHTILLANGTTHVLSEDGNLSGSRTLVYRKNEVKTIISDGSNNTSPVEMVVKGDDVFILLDSRINSEGTPQIARNGQVASLPYEDNGYRDASPSALFISDGDDYVVGGGKDRAFLWKNGAVTVLHENGYASDIWVTGGN